MTVVETLLLVSIALVLIRLVVGPTPWDRLLTFNTASNRAVVLIATVAVATGETLYLNVVVAYAALSFLGAVIIARFLEQGGGHR